MKIHVYLSALRYMGMRFRDAGFVYAALQVQMAIRALQIEMEDKARKSLTPPENPV
jgi:hypothetical protein